MWIFLAQFFNTDDVPVFFVVAENKHSTGVKEE